MISVAAVAILLSFLFLLRYILNAAYLSSLSRIPNAHFSSPFLNVWTLWQRYHGRENQAIHAAHERLGPVVRLGRTEISVNDPQCVKVIYGNDFDRHDFYGAFSNYGAPNMFSVADKGSHTARKRAFASVYSKTNLQASAQWETMARVILMERLLPALEAAAKDNNPVEILELGLAISMDFVTSYLFGLGNDSNFLQDLNARMQWLNAYHGSKRMSFLSMEFPTLNGLLSKISSTFISGDASAAANDMKMICLEKMEVIEKSSSRTVLSSKSIPKGSTSTRPVVYDQLNSPFSSQSSSNPPLSSSTPTRLDVASELMDHVMAGSETTTWTLTYVFHELSQQPKLQLSLRSELLTLSPSLVYPNKSRLPIPRAIDALPLLDAVILETLRLHPSVPGSQLRITPSASSTVALSTYNYIPANITVSAQAYSLHRNASVFPEPETWRPERWLVDKEQRDEMMRWFWAFGSGARGCIGKDFAMQEMKLVIAAIYTSYVTSVVDDEGIEQGDGYSTGPKRNRLVLHFERASET